MSPFLNVGFCCIFSFAFFNLMLTRQSKWLFNQLRNTTNTYKLVQFECKSTRAVRSFSVYGENKLFQITELSGLISVSSPDSIRIVLSSPC